MNRFFFTLTMIFLCSAAVPAQEFDGDDIDFDVMNIMPTPEFYDENKYKDVETI